MASHFPLQGKIKLVNDLPSNSSPLPQHMPTRHHRYIRPRLHPGAISMFPSVFSGLKLGNLSCENEPDTHQQLRPHNP